MMIYLDVNQISQINPSLYTKGCGLWALTEHNIIYYIILYYNIIYCV